ncbi:MAG TPA: MDR family MFS transporter [Candidatus Limnocylindria bacterium]|nr:MDR family MFS transporter [Candidatus Limnocylindria bacterium]
MKAARDDERHADVAPPVARRSRARRLFPHWLTRDQIVGLVVVMTGMAVAALDTTVVGTAMPTAIGDLGGIERYSWVFAAYLLASTATTPVFGRFADVHGRKRVYLVALVVFVGASMLCGQSATMDQLIAFRALQGLGAGALISTGITMIGDLFDARQRGRMQGFTSGVWATAALVGPAIGGVITQSLSWRWTFYVNLPIGLIALALLLTLHEREEHRGGAIDWPGAAAFAGATTLLLLGVNGTLPLATFAGAIALAAIFVAIERRTAEPLVDLSLLGIPLIGIGLALSLLMGVLQFGATTFVPPFAQGVLARPPIEAGFALSSMGIGWPIGAVATGWFLMRIGMRRAVITGALLSLGGAALFTTLTPESPLALLVLATASVGLGQGVMNPPLLIAVQSAVGYGRRGIVTSLFNFSRSLGGAVGVAALGATLNTVIAPRAEELRALLDPVQHVALGALATEPRALLSGGLHTVFVALALLSVVGLVLALRLPPHDFAESEPPEAAG